MSASRRSEKSGTVVRITATPDVTSLTTSSRNLLRKHHRKCHLRWLQVEFLEYGLSDDREIAVLIGDTRPHKLMDMTSLAASGQLQNAIKYCTKVHETGVAGKVSNNSATV